MSRTDGRDSRIAAGLGALLAAAVLFLLAESAVARRVGADLFLPFAEGVFLPGRMARMGAALVLCLALGLTGAGRKLLDRADAALEKDRYRWLTAALATGLFFLWAFRVTVPAFMTNDDAAIMRAIGRIPAQGLRSAEHTFSNILFCGFLSLFYRLAPGGYWYAWYHLAAIFLGVTVVGRCALLKAVRRGWRFPACLAPQGLLCLGLFLAPTAQLSFTVTPAVLGAAAAALILCRDDLPGRAGHIAADLGAAALLLLSYLQRIDTGRVALCFWALAEGYRLLRLLLAGREDRLRALAALALAVALTAGLVLGVGGYSLPMDEAQYKTDRAYNKAEYYRSMVMDYLLDGLTNEQLEQTAASIRGLEAGTVMDERISTDAFRTITLAYLPAHADDAGNDSFTGGWDSFSAALAGISEEDRAVMETTAAVMALLLALALLDVAGRGRRAWPEALCAACAVAGTAVLAAYLLWQGRFPLRSFMAISVPSVTTLTLMALAVPDGAPVRARTGVRALSALGLAGLCVLAGLCAAAVPYIGQSVTRDDVFFSQHVTEQYALAHPDVTFITNSLEQDLDPFHTADGYPDNIRLWGGTGIAASDDRLYADAFFREDVRFMYRYPSTVVSLMQYLTLDQGPVQARSEAQLSQDIFVVELSRVLPPEEGYTGWYDRNGMTYYFENGAAVTGERTIDGESCTFAPAGAAARLAVIPGPDGLIYSTDAYSLTSPEEQAP